MDAAQGDIAWQFKKVPISLQEAVDLAAKAKDEGNKCYKSKTYEKGVAYYKAGLSKLKSAQARKLPGTQAGAEGTAPALAAQLETSLQLNVAMCLVKLSAWEEAISACSTVLRRADNAGHPKALLWRAKAFAASPHRADGLSKAKSDLEAALKSAPTDSLVLSELKSVKQRLQEDGSSLPATATATSGQTNSRSPAGSASAAPTGGKANASSSNSSSQASAAAADVPKRLPNSSAAGGNDDDEEKEADAQLKAGFRKALHAGSGSAKGSGKKNSGSGSGGGLLGDTRTDQVPSTTTRGGGGDESTSSLSPAMSPEEAAIRAEDARRRAEAAAIAAVEEQDDDDDSGAAVSGYRTRPDGVKVPAWSRSESDGSSSTANSGSASSGSSSSRSSNSGAPVRLPVAAPQKLPSTPSTDLSTTTQGRSNSGSSSSSSSTSAARSSGNTSGNTSGSGGATFNRGYRERDMTSWCVSVLLRDVLSGELAFKLPNCEGTLKLMLPCKDLRGDALMVARHGTWDHTFDFSFSVQWEAKVGQPRMEEVEVKGKKQMMFLGLPTYEGSLRFADVSHLQSAWDYDLEVLWGGDRPKLKLPTGHAKQLLTSLLEPTESGLQGLLRHRLHAFAQAYRNIQDPQKAIDELVARTATASGLSTPLVLSHKDVCGGGGGESGDSSSSSSGDNDSIVEVNTANALVKATSAGEISSDSSDVVVSKSSSDGVVPPASVSGPVPLPAPWLWATRAELEEVPDDKSKAQIQQSAAGGGGGSAGSVTIPSGGSGGVGSGEGVSFDPLKTPKMLNYLEKLSEEGYAVFVGDGKDDEEKKGAMAKKSKAEEGKDTGEGSLVASLKERVAQVVGNKGEQVADNKSSKAAVNTADAADAPPPAPSSANAAAKKNSGGSKKKGKKGGSKGKKGAKGQGGGGGGGGSSASERKAQGKDALDYTRFDATADSVDDGNDGSGGGGGSEQEGSGDIPSGIPPEEYPEELRDLAENPLWHAVLRAAGGDGEKALSLLSDPEALRKHPEISALFPPEEDQEAFMKEWEEEFPGEPLPEGMMGPAPLPKKP